MKITKVEIYNYRILSTLQMDLENDMSRVYPVDCVNSRLDIKQGKILCGRKAVLALRLIA